jgi:hypothetical protein
MYRSKDLTFCKDKLYVCRVGEQVKVRSYDYSKITDASKSRLENLQFGRERDMMTLFTQNNKEVFTVLNWSYNAHEH